MKQLDPVDVLKRLAAKAAKRESEHPKSLAAICKSNGMHWRQVLRERKKELEILSAAGLTVDDLSHLWKVGDIVTRDGTDEHEIVGINESRDLLDLVCIKEPADKWIAIGERDSNLTRRYSFVRPGKEAM